MATEENKEYLDVKALILLLILTLVWGINHPSIKYVNQGIAPVFASALRSVIASLCGVIYCLWRKEKIFHTDINLLHGVVVGLLFGLEFACIYIGLLYTDAARSIIFLYTSPFIVAVGAHFLLDGDRLTSLKTLGLVAAFMGVLVVFYGRPDAAKPSMFIGDILEIIAAFFWAATTLYVKRMTVREELTALQLLFYQLAFSAPLLLVAALVLERGHLTIAWRADSVLSLVYQTVVIAAVSYLAWFWLIQQYRVTSLGSFTFLSPLFGVILGGVLLGEELPALLWLGLALAAAGIYLVNRPPRAAAVLEAGST